VTTDVFRPGTALVHGRPRRDRADAPILLVGDEPADLRLLKRFLKRAGYNAVATASDTRSAVRSHLELRSDVVVLDLDMEGADGFEVMEQLQCATPTDAYPPVFVLAGSLSTRVREEALAMGAKALLGKPLDYYDVVVCMENMLETRALHLELSEIAHGISNFMSVIRNYAEFVVSGIDQRTQRGEQGWSEIRRDAEEIRLAAERSTAFTNQVLALRGNEEKRARRTHGR
jgi:CheY-like chemotaxis protein